MRVLDEGIRIRASAQDAANMAMRKAGRSWPDVPPCDWKGELLEGGVYYSFCRHCGAGEGDECGWEGAP